MSIRGITFPKQKVQPKDDAIIHSRLVADGILEGCSLTAASGKARIAAGYMIIAGRVINVSAAEEVTPLSGTGTQLLVVKIDTNGTSTAQSFNQVSFRAAASDYEVVQEDINGGTGHIYELAIASITVESGQATEVTPLLFPAGRVIHLSTEEADADKMENGDLWMTVTLPS